MLPQLLIGIFVQSEELAGCTIELLRGDRYVLTYIKSAVEFLGFLKKHNYVDCWVFEVDGDLISLLNKLQERSLFLPTVIFSPHPGEDGRPEIQALEGFEAGASTADKSQEQSCAFFYQKMGFKTPSKSERASPSVAGFIFTGGTLTSKCAIIV